MSTYLVAQLMIVLGVVQRQRDDLAHSSLHGLTTTRPRRQPRMGLHVMHR